VFAASENGVVTWDVSRPGQPLMFVDGTQNVHPKYDHLPVVSPDDRLLGFRGRNHLIRMWELGAEKAVHRFTFPEPGTGGTFSHDGNLLAIGCYEEAVFHDLSRRGEPRRSKALKTAGDVWSVHFNQDSKQVVMTTDLGVVEVRDLVSEAIVFRWKLPGLVNKALFADDNRHLFLHNSNATIYVLRLPETRAP
jgi:hypothetical protein